MTMDRTYIAIDLKSFYASVECMDRGLDPLTTNLVVADESRTQKTICLAVSPSLKQYGISGRARLFEAVRTVKEANRIRLARSGLQSFKGESHDSRVLQDDPSKAISFITAVPRMARYMEVSARIYQVYLGYIAPEDIHVYSVDEVFIDATGYMSTYHMTGHELAMTMIKDVLAETGITATAGIGTNLYLAKIAMDIVAKKMPADSDGVRIAELDEMSYRRNLWSHRPLTSFWRVGKGIADRLESHGMFTMGDIALRSLYNEDSLYRLFGVNAELLIDHAWGREPVCISDIKAYKPDTNSIGSGQVLQEPYTNDKALVVIMEMADAIAMDLVDKGLVTDQLTITAGYDIENLSLHDTGYDGETETDRYGRKVPKSAHGTINLERQTSSSRMITEAAVTLFMRITDPALLIRRMYVTACKVVPEPEAGQSSHYGEQLDLFTDFAAMKKQQEEKDRELEQEHRRQQAILDIRTRFGKNAILKGTSMKEGATARSRNSQIGGHKA
ncbi:MAG: DNA methylase [Parasporobacterium sp.]|nr:DNA methylase [Parasporobacterium sp.]